MNWLGEKEAIIIARTQGEAAVAGKEEKNRCVFLENVTHILWLLRRPRCALSADHPVLSPDFLTELRLVI